MAALLLVAIPSHTAWAGTLTRESTFSSATYTAAAGEANVVELSLHQRTVRNIFYGNPCPPEYWGDPFTTDRFRVTDSGGTFAQSAARCEQERDPDPPWLRAECWSYEPQEARCEGPIYRVNVTLGDRDDRLATTASMGRTTAAGPCPGGCSIILRVDGGPGDDTVDLAAAPGPSPEYLTGGPGNDVLRGREENTSIDETTRESGGGADVLFGGPGLDDLSYADRTGGVAITVDGQPNDGEPGEADNIQDVFEELRTGSGDDAVVLPATSDQFEPGLYTGAGDDVVDVRNGSPNRVSCDEGTDRVAADAQDFLDSCEQVECPPGHLFDTKSHRCAEPSANRPPCAFNPKGGTDRNDALTGSSDADLMAGGKGDDVLRGLAGADCLYGGYAYRPSEGLDGSGNDQLHGGSGADKLQGGFGDDRLDGGPGADVIEDLSGRDRLLGGTGPDKLSGGRDKETLIGGGGKDTLRAHAGRDTVRARDRSRDIVDCGGGIDRAIVDRRDRVRNCEIVRRG